MFGVRSWESYFLKLCEEFYYAARIAKHCYGDFWIVGRQTACVTQRKKEEGIKYDKIPNLW